MTQTMTQNMTQNMTQTMTSLERALVRLLMTGCGLEDAAQSVGLSPLEAEAALRELQNRCGASGTTRLLALAVLKSWV